MTRSSDHPVRLAWFSPMPPVRSGIATNSADLVRRMAADYEIDVFVDTPADGAQSAHDFVWRHRRKPYDLTVFQIGNSSHHNFQWPYLFRCPGLAVLHDVHLHHARAALLLTEGRVDQYRAEFTANHPGANPDLAELATAGFDSHLYYMWPMTRLILQASRLAVVHSRGMADRLREELPGAAVEVIRLTQGEEVSGERETRARQAIRLRYGFPPDALILGVFGGITPEKRIPQILEAFAAAAPSAPAARLLLAGAPAPQYDAHRDIAARGLKGRAIVTGYLETDDEMTDAIAASDVVLNLRWPTAREVSGPWLRALAAGKPTVTIDLAHLWDVPSLDPRTWMVNLAGVRDPGSGIRFTDDGLLLGSRDLTPDLGSPPSRFALRRPGRIPDSGPPPSRFALRRPGRTPDPESRTPEPVTVAIDILDEDHSLRLALRRLATDPALRASLGAAARRYWREHHSPDRSVEDYHRVIALALRRDVPRPVLPRHLSDDGDGRLRALLGPFGVGVHFEDSAQR